MSGCRVANDQLYALLQRAFGARLWTNDVLSIGRVIFDLKIMSPFHLIQEVMRIVVVVFPAARSLHHYIVDRSSNYCQHKSIWHIKPKNIEGIYVAGKPVSY
jgi:hypothetical protein